MSYTTCGKKIQFVIGSLNLLKWASSLLYSAVRSNQIFLNFQQRVNVFCRAIDARWNCSTHQRRCRSGRALRGFSLPVCCACPILAGSCRQRHWRWTCHQDGRRCREPSCRGPIGRRDKHRHRHPIHELLCLASQMRGKVLHGLPYCPPLQQRWSMLLHCPVPMRYTPLRVRGLWVRPENIVILVRVTFIHLFFQRNKESNRKTPIEFFKFNIYIDT